MLLSAILLAALWPTAHAGERQVVEEIVARVNNEIITLSDLERSRQLLRQELNQRNSGAELERLYQEQEPNLLRDLIDQQLLVQRALDRGLSVESEVIKRLDQIRQDMKLTSMEELERAMAAQGMSMEDFKQEIRNQLLTQTLIQRAVAGNVFVDAEKVRHYYLTHREELAQPEQVRLREILVSTEGYPASQLPAREERVREVIVKIRQGEDFEELAREYSDAPTAEQGGELGYFEPDKLAPSIREAIGNLLEEGVSDAIRTREGWLLLQLVEHRPPGIPPFEDVESRIRDQLYMAEVQPALREFLNDLRREAFVYVKTGYQDSGEVEEEARPVRAGSRRSKRRRRPD
jgi:peptidyl-prolyl cis-trans isomerase SurA